MVHAEVAEVAEARASFLRVLRVLRVTILRANLSEHRQLESTQRDLKFCLEARGWFTRRRGGRGGPGFFSPRSPRSPRDHSESESLRTSTARIYPKTFESCRRTRWLVHAEAQRSRRFGFLLRV